MVILLNFNTLTLSYISQTEERLNLARLEYEKKRYNIVIRLCQEAVSLAV